jgi:hypothetical protein
MSVGAEGMTYYTTLKKIKEYSPCKNGWEKLLRNLGKTKADNEPLSIITVLESNGVNDAVWCLRAIDDIDKDARLFAVWCARQVQHLMTDQKSITALDVAERHATGNATDAELSAARAAAWAAADAAADAAEWAAARAAASAEARDVAKDAARDAAWAAARDAAWAAAGAAASAAARDAAWAAARDAALTAAVNAQAAEFRRRFGGADSAAIAKAEGKE